MHRTNQRLLGFFAVGAIALAALLVLSACSSGSSKPANTSTASGNTTDTSAFNGVRPEPPVAKPDITLTDTSGQPFNIVNETKGDLTLLYMGYTNCPDVCPTFMAQLGQIMKSMPPSVTKNIKVIFVTTDPARDTDTVIRKWLDHFDSSFIGLRGTEAQVDQISAMLGVPAPQKEPEADGNYGVTHGAFFYAFDKVDNKAHLIYPLGFKNPALKADFTKLATKGYAAYANKTS